MHTYDKVFFDYIQEGSLKSSLQLVPVVQSLLNVSSVLDVGCGRGAWLKTWSDLGVTDFVGVDGEYVDTDLLLINEKFFHSKDITNTFDLKRKFELVQCLEVAEHIKADHAKQLVKNICRHGDCVLFSAAPPGQGGEHHVNERPYSYWQEMFKAEGYEMFDAVRSGVVDCTDVLPWYKYNTFIFIKNNRNESLWSELKTYKVEGAPMDISPKLYKVRKKIISILGVHVSTLLAQLKKHIICFKLKFTS